LGHIRNTGVSFNRRPPAGGNKFAWINNKFAAETIPDLGASHCLEYHAEQKWWNG